MAADLSNSIAPFLPTWAYLDQSETDLVVSRFESVWLKPKAFFIKTGQPVTKIAFVAQGILYRYWFDEMGDMFIDQFLRDQQFFTDREGFFHHQASFTNIQALSPCHIYSSARFPIWKNGGIRTPNSPAAMIPSC